MVDLRALAERLGMLKDCGCILGCERCDLGFRLPTEAELRAAIFEAGWTDIDQHVSPHQAAIHLSRPGRPAEHRYAFAYRDEAAADDLVLLALLRALEVCRG